MTLFGWTLACSSAPAPEPAVPIWDMRNHDRPAVAARDAVRAGDLETARRAGEALARPDPAPGLPELGVGPLRQVREGGAGLARSSDLAEAAAGLMAVTEGCARCHLAVGVEAPGGEPLWTAVVFESEALWVQGADRPALAAAREWGARREVLARVLSAPR